MSERDAISEILNLKPPERLKKIQEELQRIRRKLKETDINMSYALAKTGSSGGGALTKGQIVEVAKSGALYTSIQAAVDSITDNSASKRYAVIIYPGIYTENISMKPFVSLIAIGGKETTEITETSGVLVTAPVDATSSTIISGLTLSLYPTVQATRVFFQGTGNVDLIDCKLIMAFDRSLFIDMDGYVIWFNGGNLQAWDCTFTHSTTNSSTNVWNQLPITLSGSGFYRFHSCVYEMNESDENDLIIGIQDGMTGNNECFFISFQFHVIVNNANFANGAVGIFTSNSGGANQRVIGCEFSVENIGGGGGGVGYFMYMDTLSDSGYMTIVGSNFFMAGFALNYSFHADTGDLVEVLLNVVEGSTDGPTGPGAVNFVVAESVGNLKMSGVFYAYNQPRCRAYQATLQSIPGGTWTPITFDAENFDTQGMHSPTVNNTQITIPVGMGGTYLIVGQVRFDPNTIGVRAAQILLNGATVLTETGFNSKGATIPTPVPTAPTVEQLTPGDYIELLGFQNAPLALNTTPGRQYTYLILIMLH